MKKPGICFIVAICLPALALFLAAQPRALAATEMLAWNTGGQHGITCVYGEVTVLATTTPVYYCGAEWWGVGGYSGIQDIKPGDRRTIFSIWDTSPQLHPQVTAADSHTIFNRFTGEGEGAHTHLPLDWKLGEPFQFFLQKTPGKTAATTDTSFYIFDRAANKWRHIATISSPNGDKNKGATFDGLASWIENIGGKADVATPKVALYSLWAGASPGALKPLTRTGGRSGSGRWGILQGTYFLAEGSPENLAAFFAAQKQKYGEPVFGVDGKELPPIPAGELPANVVQDLKNLPQAPPAATPGK